MPFGIWTLVGPGKHVFDVVPVGATWRTRLNRPCAAAMRPFYRVTLTTCWKFLTAKVNGDFVTSRLQRSHHTLGMLLHCLPWELVGTLSTCRDVNPWPWPKGQISWPWHWPWHWPWLWDSLALALALSFWPLPWPWPWMLWPWNK